MQKIYSLIIFIGLLVVLPSTTFAGPIIRTGEEVSVGVDQTLKGDFYGFGSRVVVSGTAENDTFLGGGTVTVNAPTQQDLTIVGGVVQVHGDVGDDIRVIGGEVTIAKPVKGDVVVVGGSLTILSTAEVSGDVIFYGSELEVDGKVFGSIHGATERARIDAEVGGDLSLAVQSSLTLGSGARVSGNVTYESAVDMTRAQDAVVNGDVHKAVPSTGAQSRADFVKGVALELLMLLFATLTLFALARQHTTSLIAEATTRPGHYGLVGIGLIFVLPIVSVVLFGSVLGIFLGALLLLSYLSLIIIALVTTPLLLGYGIQKLILKDTVLRLSTIGMGALALLLMGFVPVLGAIVLMGLILINIGVLGTKIYRMLRRV